jgi:predicted amidohydrolase YtcJ
VLRISEKQGGILLLRRLACVTAVISGILLFAGLRSRSAAPPAETIIRNAKIYTMSPDRPWAQALAIRGGKIVAVGTNAEVLRLRGPATKSIDAQGHLVLPGFTDCHIHFLEGSLSLTRAELSGSKNVVEIQSRLKEYAAVHPGKGWIRGQGWSYEMFGKAPLPDKKWIDQVIPDRPVFLESFDGHTLWANGKALEIAGITRTTPDPPNGQIVRDSQTGEATGALKEFAGDLVEKFIPPPTREEKLAALRAGLADANRAGLVRVHSAGGDFDDLDLFDELRRSGNLTLRFYVADIVQPPELTPGEIEKLEQARRRYHDDWVSAGAVKFFMDGVIETHTAAVLGSYADDTTQSGKPFWDSDKYNRAVAELDRRGFQIFTHAIGDRAVRMVLDAYERAQNANGNRDDRPRIEHIETVSPQDVPRFGRLGVIASMQPLHAYPNPENAIWIRNAGPEREKLAFAWHSIEAGGGRLAFGSDWNVVTLNPWKGVQTALTRQTEEGYPAGGWVPSQRVTLEEAIRAYTLGAAFAGRREKTEGSLDPGKAADLIMLSQNLFEVDPHAVGRTTVLLTMVDGKTVYEAAGWAQQDLKGGPAKP